MCAGHAWVKEKLKIIERGVLDNHCTCFGGDAEGLGYLRNCDKRSARIIRVYILLRASEMISKNMKKHHVKSREGFEDITFSPVISGKDIVKT